MDDRSERRRQAASDSLHPAIYLTIVSLALLFVLGSWGFAFAGGGYITLALVAVTGLVTIAVLIPSAIYLAGRSAGGEDEPAEPLREWLAGDFQTWQARITSTSAATEILLPIAAVAFGMVAFAIVLNVVERTAT